MSQAIESSIRVGVDPTNPGQFFACCGLLELADRLWAGAEGWFEPSGNHFSIRRPPSKGEICSTGAIIEELARCRMTNTMTSAQLARREELAAMPKKQREAIATLEAEKKALDALWREAPIQFHEPFNLRLDWFVDERAGGDTFKTWAGQQSVIDIARGMKAPIDAGDWNGISPEDWLFKSTDSDDLPFNFDSSLGAMGSPRDVGFSFDPLKELSVAAMRVRTRPLIELAAFVGLQRFRPVRVEKKNQYQFSTWFDPLVPQVAAAAACGLLGSARARAFEFRLLYRTKYLKSFLPANPIARS